MKSYWIVYFNWLNCTICELYLNKAYIYTYMYVCIYQEGEQRQEEESFVRKPMDNTFFFLQINIFIYLFIYLWLHQFFVAVCGLSLVAASGGYSSLRGTGFSLRWLLLLQSTGSRCMGFSSCGTQAQQLWLMGLVTPWHVGSSWTRARTRVPCIGRWILNHWAPREVPTLQSNIELSIKMKLGKRWA